MGAKGLGIYINMIEFMISGANTNALHVSCNYNYPCEICRQDWALTKPNTGHVNTSFTGSYIQRNQLNKLGTIPGSVT